MNQSLINAAIFTLNPNKEEIVFGLIYAVVSFFLLPLYFLVMLTLYLKDRRQANMTFKLMNVINFFEVGQSFLHFVSFPILLFPAMQVRFDTIIRVTACTINSFWIAELPLMSVLAISRILVFSDIIKTGKLHFGIKVSIGIILSWISFVLIVGSITGNMTFSSPVWVYDEEVEYATVFEDLELIVSFPSLAVSYISYIVIIIKIYSQKKKSSIRSRKNEVAILLQYTFVASYMTILIIMWHKGDIWFDMTNPRLQATINVFWIACSYLSPVMLLILNVPIRQECFSLIGIELQAKTGNNRRTTSMWSIA